MCDSNPMTLRDQPQPDMIRRRPSSIWEVIVVGLDPESRRPQDRGKGSRSQITIYEENQIMRRRAQIGWRLPPLPSSVRTQQRDRPG